MLIAAAALGAALFLAPTSARAQDDAEVGASGEAAPVLASGLRLSLKLEPGIAMPLSNPQSQIYDAGFGQTIKLLIGLSRFVEVGPSATFTSLAADDESMAETGTAWSFGASARVMRPRDAVGGTFSAASPWVDADLLYVRTGGLDRAGFAGGVGVAFPMDERRRLWLGPYARYSHILQGARDGFDDRDAKIVTVGLSLEIGTGLEQAREPEPALAEAVVEEAPAPVEPEIAPEEAVVATPEKLDVKEKIAFEWNSSRLEPSSHAALDEVVRELKANPGFRVQVEGHASSEGTEQRNQELSEERSAAVVDYLIAGGIARDRLVSKGFSSSVPRKSNKTAAGRESNRRVEFVVSFIIIEKGTAP
jgi:outer membrane protein OmpA-like peptidoglycan-associated protein